jgi:hypothetical protein
MDLSILGPRSGPQSGNLGSEEVGVGTETEDKVLVPLSTHLGTSHRVISRSFGKSWARSCRILLGLLNLLLCILELNLGASG